MGELDQSVWQIIDQIKVLRAFGDSGRLAFIVKEYFIGNERASYWWVQLLLFLGERCIGQVEHNPDLGKDWLELNQLAQSVLPELRGLNK